jgi:hypothetical protein
MKYLSNIPNKTTARNSYIIYMMILKVCYWANNDDYFVDNLSGMYHRCRLLLMVVGILMVQFEWLNIIGSRKENIFIFSFWFNYHVVLFQVKRHAIVDGMQNIRGFLWLHTKVITTMIMYAWTKMLNQSIMTHQIKMALCCMGWEPRVVVWDVLHTRITQKCFVLYAQYKLFIHQ